MATGDESDSRPWYRRYRTSIVLAVLGVAGVVVSLAIFPHTSSVEVHGGVGGVAVLSTFTPTNIDLAERSVGAGTIEMRVVVRASSATDPHPGEITVVVPAAAWGSPHACPPAAESCTIDAAGLEDVHYDLATLGWTSVAGADPQFRYGLALTIDVPHGGSNVAENAEFIATMLPPVRVQVAPSGSYRSVRDVTVPVKYSQQARHTGYTWSVGTVPVHLAGSYVWLYTSAADIQSAVSPSLDSGTDLAVQDHVTTMTFVAGAAVGVALGALVGAVQTALDTQAEASEARSRRRSPATTQ